MCDGVTACDKKTAKKPFARQPIGKTSRIRRHTTSHRHTRLLIVLPGSEPYSKPNADLLAVAAAIGPHPIAFPTKFQ